MTARRAKSLGKTGDQIASVIGRKNFRHSATGKGLGPAG